MTGDGPATRRVLFWGGKRLGYRCLAHLAELARSRGDVRIVGVGVSLRDARRGGDDRTAVAGLAGRLGLPVFTEHEEVTVRADVGLAVGYPHLIPGADLERCRDGALNLHMAPLPHYRGTKTVVHAILNGDRRYGVTLHYMDTGLDTGDVVEVRWLDVAADATAEQVMELSIDVGFDLVAGYLPRILVPGRLPAVRQSDLVSDLMASGVEPRYCTRRSIEPLYRLPADADFDTLHRYARALSTGDGRAPYIEQDGRRVYLSTTPPDPRD